MATALQAAQTLVAEAPGIRDTASGAARELWGQSGDTRAMLAVQGAPPSTACCRACAPVPCQTPAELSRAIEDARAAWT